MKLLITNKSGELLEEVTEPLRVTLIYLAQLQAKFILKSKDIKSIAYKYNCSSAQTITVYFATGCKYVFENIPTSWGTLDTETMQHIIENTLK